LNHESSVIARFCVLGVPLAVTDYAGAVAQAREWAATGGRPHAIAAANTHLVTLARRDPAYRAALEKFDLLLPDGMPLVWVMNRQLPEPLRDRVYGPTFMLQCLEATQGAPWSHFFLGGSEELLTALTARLGARFPALSIAGTCAPPFGEWPPEEDERLLAQLRAAAPSFVWIGLGCPKQEQWIARVHARLPAAVYVAVGAAFAFHAGRVKQAPRWMQSAGLEWVFRLATEPRRLWRRYFVFNTLFLFHLWRDRPPPPLAP